MVVTYVDTLAEGEIRRLEGISFWKQNDAVICKESYNNDETKHFDDFVDRSSVELNQVS